MTVSSGRGRIPKSYVSTVIPRNRVIRIAPSHVRTTRAFWASGRLNAATPSETASTPVSAGEPEENAGRIRKSPTASSPSGPCAECAAGDEPRAGAQVVLADDVRAAPLGVRVDRLPVGAHDDRNQDRDGDGDGERVAQRDAPGENQDQEDFLGRVRHRGERVGGEDGERRGLAEALVPLLRGRERGADGEPLQTVQAHRVNSTPAGTSDEKAALRTVAVDRSSRGSRIARIGRETRPRSCRWGHSVASRCAPRRSFPVGPSCTTKADGGT